MDNENGAACSAVACGACCCFWLSLIIKEQRETARYVIPIPCMLTAQDSTQQVSLYAGWIVNSEGITCFIGARLLLCSIHRELSEVERD